MANKRGKASPRASDLCQFSASDGTFGASSTRVNPLGLELGSADAFGGQWIPVIAVGDALFYSCTPPSVRPSVHPSLCCPRHTLVLCCPGPLTPVLSSARFLGN